MAWLQSFANHMNRKVKETEEEEEMPFRPLEEVVSEKVAPAPAPRAEENATLSASSEAGGNINLKFSKPTAYSTEEVAPIAEYLLEGYIVVLDVSEMSKESMTRLLDFLDGVTYVTNGVISQKNSSTFIITPSNVNIDE